MNQQELQKLQAKLETKEQALDEREARVGELRKWAEEQESKFKAREIEERSLEARILVKENNLKDKQAQLDALDETLTDNGMVLEALQADIEAARAEHSSQKLKLQHSLSELRQETLDAEYEVKRINVEIKERQNYLKAQELTIGQTIEAANEQIKDLQEQSGDYEDRKARLHAEIAEAEKDIVDVLYRLSVVENDLRVAKETLEAELSQLGDQITEREKYLSALEEDIDQADSVNSKRDQALKERELSIATKLDVIRKEREELELEKRRYKAGLGQL